MQREVKNLNKQALLEILFIKTWHFCPIPFLHASPFPIEPKRKNRGIPSRALGLLL